jgi:hypothetical protein
MRAILVEVPDHAIGTIEATHRRLADPPQVSDLTPARGRLADRELRPEEHDDREGEPW